MDNLKNYYPENFTKEVIEEINSMTTEQLQNLENIPGYFLIRDKSSNRPYTGQSTFKNLAILHRLGFKQKYEVVGVHAESFMNSNHQEEVIELQEDELIEPEKQIVKVQDEVIESEKQIVEETNQEEVIELQEDELIEPEKEEKKSTKTRANTKKDN